MSTLIFIAVIVICILLAVGIFFSALVDALAALGQLFMGTAWLGTHIADFFRKFRNLAYKK